MNLRKSCAVWLWKYTACFKCNSNKNVFLYFLSSFPSWNPTNLIYSLLSSPHIRSCNVHTLCNPLYKALNLQRIYVSRFPLGRVPLTPLRRKRIPSGIEAFVWILLMSFLNQTQGVLLSGSEPATSAVLSAQKVKGQSEESNLGFLHDSAVHCHLAAAPTSMSSLYYYFSLHNNHFSA